MWPATHQVFGASIRTQVLTIVNYKEEQLAFNTLAQGLWLRSLAVALGNLHPSNTCLTQGKVGMPSQEATQISYSDSKKQGAQSRTPREGARASMGRSMLGQNARRLLRSDSRSSCVVEVWR